MTQEIIKRGSRKTEQFQEEKLRTSILAACLSVQAPEGQAESVAKTVCNEVATWLEKRPEVTSHDLRRVASKALDVHHPEAAYLYQQQAVTI